MKPKNLLRISFVVCAITIAACIHIPSPSPTSQGSIPPTGTSTQNPVTSSTIKIGTFNIQNLGLTKIGKAEVVAALVGIIRKYDVIAVDEISDKSNVTAFRFLDSINKNQTVRYGLVLSQRTGQQPNNLSSQEQYGFYYNTSTIKDLGQSMLYNDSIHDYFCREPFLAHFKTNNGNFSFVLCAIHTKPEAALEEIRSLHEVLTWAKTKYADEDDFIALGDFNASCTYVTPAQLDTLEIRKSSYKWIIADTVKTNLSSKQCAYDRIVMTNPATTQDYTGNWGVDRCFTSKTISDHWPVWAEFFTNNDNH